jgi:hypothetical protein
MFVQPYAVVQRAQQQRPTLGIGNLWRGRNSFFLHQKIRRCLGAVLHDLHHHAERGNKQKPNA